MRLFGGKIGFVGSGIHSLSSQILSKSFRNWFENRTLRGTSMTTKSLFKLLVVFFLYLLKSAMRHTQDPISALLADDGYYRRSE